MYPQTLFHDAASNIIYLVLFGTRYDYGDETLKVYVRLYSENAKLANGPWAMVSSILFDLYNTFNNRHCHNAALQKCSGFQIQIPIEQARGVRGKGNPSSSG